MEAICLRLKGVGRWLQVKRVGDSVGLRAAGRGVGRDGRPHPRLLPALEKDCVWLRIEGASTHTTHTTPTGVGTGKNNSKVARSTGLAIQAGFLLDGTHPAGTLPWPEDNPHNTPQHSTTLRIRHDYRATRHSPSAPNGPIAIGLVLIVVRKRVACLASTGGATKVHLCRVQRGVHSACQLA